MTRLTSKPTLFAAVLFAAIFVLRATVGTTGDAFSFLYIVPVVLVAVTYGVRGGLVAGAVAFVLASLGSVLSTTPPTALGYVNRLLVYLFVGGLVGSFADRLRRLEAESARHFNFSLDMICVAGFDGYFKRVNPAFERILGFTQAELLGRPFVEFVHPDDRERTENEAVAIGSGSGTVQFQNRYLDRDGKVHWIEWTSFGVPEEDLIYAVARDVTKRKALESELERLSRHDALTGMLNRRSFDEALEAQLAYTRRYGSGGAVLAIDLDRFKSINDRFGHAAGDDALRLVAEVLERNLRRSDSIGRDAGNVAARLGGDEFAVLLPEADAAGAEAAADRIVAALAESPLDVEGTEVRLSLSIGIALFDDAGCPPAKDLMVAADRALYVIKAAGGDGASLAAAPA
jgi:diguanylate cyclase (GGDEF)-like protein/PAS domain S-box-containing protein